MRKLVANWTKISSKSDLRSFGHRYACWDHFRDVWRGPFHDQPASIYVWSVPGKEEIYSYDLKIKSNVLSCFYSEWNEIELMNLDKMNLWITKENTASQAPIPITITIRKNNIGVWNPRSGVVKFLWFRDQLLLHILIYLY